MSTSEKDKPESSGNDLLAKALGDGALELPTMSVTPPEDSRRISVLAAIEMFETYLPAQNARADFIEHRISRHFDRPFWI